MLKKAFLGLAIGASLVSILSTAALADWDHSHFDGWMRSHHDVAVEIQQHPRYLRDHDWLSRHHDVQVWLNTNPNYVTSYTANPYPIIVDEHHHNGHWHEYSDHHWGY